MRGRERKNASATDQRSDLCPFPFPPSLPQQLERTKQDTPVVELFALLHSRPSLMPSLSHATLCLRSSRAARHHSGSLCPVCPTSPPCRVRARVRCRDPRPMPPPASLQPRLASPVSLSLPTLKMKGRPARREHPVPLTIDEHPPHLLFKLARNFATRKYFTRVWESSSAGAEPNLGLVPSVDRDCARAALLVSGASVRASDRRTPAPLCLLRRAGGNGLGSRRVREGAPRSLPSCLQR